VSTPLWMAPGGLGDQLAEHQGTSREEALRSMASKSPRGRMGSEDEIAAVVAFLCSELAANVNGAVWTVDAGMLATIF
jgi:3-oxoacyl-[acyl-carrier protein] reductase